MKFLLLDLSAGINAGVLWQKTLESCGRGARALAMSRLSFVVAAEKR